MASSVLPGLEESVTSSANPLDGVQKVNRHRNKTRVNKTRHRLIKEPKLTVISY
jgi:hypothetical protein